MKNITLITGGARSGKSDFALRIAKKYTAKAFIATAQPFDDEMKERIKRHKQDRDASFLLVEEPIELPRAILSLPKGIEIAIIDCVTVWVGNCLHWQEMETKDFLNIDEFIEALKNASCNLVLVTNEVGMGIVPDNQLSRQYRDFIGMVNRRIAEAAQDVILMVSGIPVVIKGKLQT
jgi:adenosylcobinamide kinase / adenosylcobinamide-phosphate guanylyltransferase